MYIDKSHENNKPVKGKLLETVHEDKNTVENIGFGKSNENKTQLPENKQENRTIGKKKKKPKDDCVACLEFQEINSPDNRSLTVPYSSKEGKNYNKKNFCLLCHKLFYYKNSRIDHHLKDCYWNK